MNEPTNNKELAHAYFLVTAQLVDGEELFIVGGRQNSIKNYTGHNIVEFYKTHGSLDTLPGFQKQKKTLELILRKGVQKAREKMYADRVKKLQPQPFPTIDKYTYEELTYSPFFV